MPARIWLAVPWAVLLLDVVGATTQDSPIGLAVVADIVMIAAVVTVAIVTPWPEFQKVAAVATVAFMIQTGMAHAALVRGLTPEMIAREVVPDRVTEPRAAPRADAPGNVYHILLDNYLAESYAALANPQTRATLPGFTFFPGSTPSFHEPRPRSSHCCTAACPAPACRSTTGLRRYCERDCGEISRRPGLACGSIRTRTGCAPTMQQPVWPAAILNSELRPRSPRTLPSTCGRSD